MEIQKYQNLIEAAKEVRKNSYAPYSKFKVGAAILCQDGEVYVGCNVENASFGLTCCAERNAIFNAVAMGKSKFSAIAVVVNSPQPCTPCGACRQVLNEFCNDMDIIMVNIRGRMKVEITPLNELLPRSFDAKSL
ncbi:cytidine deaminase [Candidatus Uabimicrobium amorphum]|uniref:Cytidine deaminase n=1 Tax=Uabimicrobium amorphum TaxID=2596890 RepID=A0A5S9F1N9_UABAM|nr:cytidine deaminase [Candidatus Uabimicrobium amorphum]BBM82628.1 cytidine deaminase [Candidatus Uabimicrobium amorphum]